MRKEGSIPSGGHNRLTLSDIRDSSILPIVAGAHGWCRLWYGPRWGLGLGPGIAWKPRDAPLIFSERYGHVRSIVIGPWRLKYLPAKRGPECV